MHGQKGKITLSFTSPEKEFIFYFYAVITSRGKEKSPEHNYSWRREGVLPEDYEEIIRKYQRNTPYDREVKGAGGGD